jgi:hypothetical protein
MKNLWFLVLTLAVTSSLSQEKSVIGDFTKSPTEHIIQQIEKPFEVKSIFGTIVESGGFHERMAAVLFEIQGPGSDRKIRSTRTDTKGRFKIGRTPEGVYRFKATEMASSQSWAQSRSPRMQTSGRKLKLRCRLACDADNARVATLHCLL